VEEAKKQWEEEQKEADTVQLLVQLRGITLDPKDSSLFHGASSDPYLIFLQLGKEIGRTEVIHKNLNPFWDAVKLVAQNHHPLTIQCWDYDAMSKDDIIGQCKVEIHELVAGHFMELSIADTTAPTGRKSTGKLKVLSLMVMDKKAMAESAKHLVTASIPCPFCVFVCLAGSNLCRLSLCLLAARRPGLRSFPACTAGPSYKK
jgi:hypothetical protein